MNQRKYDRLVHDQNGPAQKVLEATPIQENWTAQKVQQELRRTGHQMQVHLVFGCLNTLKQAGLVKEPKKGEFCKVRRPRGVSVNVSTPKPRPQLHITKIEPATEEVTMTDPVDVFDNLKNRMAAIETSVANFTTSLSEELESVREAMDEAALLCMEAQEGNNEELEKLRAFRKAFEALS